MEIAFRWIDHGIGIETENPVELNRWHHIAASYGGGRAARSVSFYVDGEIQKSNLLMDILNESARTRDPLRIGGGGGPAIRFHGLIDEVRFYNAELTPKEIGILSVSKSLNELAAVPPAMRTKAESDKIRTAFFDSGAATGEIRDVFQQRKTLEDQRTKYY